MSQMQRKWEQIEARRQANKTTQGKFMGTSFVPGAEIDKMNLQKRSLETLEQTGANSLAVQDSANKGALELVSKRQEAITGRTSNQLGFDKSKFQQDFNETRRIGDRDFKQASDEALYDSLVFGERDEFGESLPGQKLYSPDEAREFMKNKARYDLEQKEKASGKGIAAGRSQTGGSIYETVGEDGIRTFSNIPQQTNGEENYPKAPSSFAGREGMDIRPPVIQENKAMSVFNRWGKGSQDTTPIQKQPSKKVYGESILASLARQYPDTGAPERRKSRLRKSLGGVRTPIPTRSREDIIAGYPRRGL